MVIASIEPPIRPPASGTAFPRFITPLPLVFESRMNSDPAFQDDFFKDNSNTLGYVLGYATGAACLGVGIPLWVKGDRQLNGIADDYNRNYGHRNLGYGSSLTVGPTRSGIGLALNF